MSKRRPKCLALVLTAILGLQEGNLALWHIGTDLPVQVFPYRTDTLPPEVRRDLEDGITFSDMDDALEAAENFCS